MEQQLKQRLVGAVVLVSLAVIFIPIILEGPGDDWSARNHTIPQPPPVDFRNDMALPLPEAAEATAAGPVAAAPATTAPLQEATPLAIPEPAAEPAQPEPPAAAKPAPVETASVPATPPQSPKALAQGWYAQVGSFSQQSNAAGLRERLVKAGFSAHLQQADTGKGSSYRVLVGPERVRADAEQLLQKLVREQQLKGIVIELPAAAG